MTPAPRAHIVPTSTLRPPTPPVGLLYTLLRHSRGLSHEEASRRTSESLNNLLAQRR